MLKLPLRQMLRTRDLKFAEAHRFLHHGCDSGGGFKGIHATPLLIEECCNGSGVVPVEETVVLEQIRQGQLAGDAGEAVGASATCGRRWFREAGGVKPAVSAPNTSGPRPRLTLEERIEIQAGVHADESMRSIADRLKRAPSTIKREIDNNTELRTRKNPKKSGYRRKHAFGANQSGASAKVAYRAMAAHYRSADRARRPKLSNLAKNDTLRCEVQSRLELFHSPEQIATRLRIDFADKPEMWVSHEAIYQAIYVQGRGVAAP